MTLSINTSYKNRLVETCKELQLDKLPYSILWGKPGEYRYYGIDIIFKEREPLTPCPTLGATLLKVYGYYFKKFADILLQRHLYVLVHELGHAFAARSLLPINPRIEIDNPPIHGICSTFGVTRSEAADNLINAAGPLAGAAFAACQAVRAAGYRDSNLTLMLLLGTGALVQMLLDFAYLIESGLRRDEGDWGKLAKSNISHFCLAAFMMMSLYALSLLMAYKILS